MILNTTLLCCAAYEGDVSMVTQLLNTTQASPNALGLKSALFIAWNDHVMSGDHCRHKNALHHAAFAGHEAIVKLLLDHGVKQHDKL